MHSSTYRHLPSYKLYTIISNEVHVVCPFLHVYINVYLVQKLFTFNDFMVNVYKHTF